MQSGSGGGAGPGYGSGVVGYFGLYKHDIKHFYISPAVVIFCNL
jgi:hypothetical protein